MVGVGVILIMPPEFLPLNFMPLRYFDAHCDQGLAFCGQQIIPHIPLGGVSHPGLGISPIIGGH